MLTETDTLLPNDYYVAGNIYTSDGEDNIYVGGRMILTGDDIDPDQDIKTQIDNLMLKYYGPNFNYAFIETMNKKEYEDLQELNKYLLDKKELYVPIDTWYEAQNRIQVRCNPELVERFADYMDWDLISRDIWCITDEFLREKFNDRINWELRDQLRKEEEETRKKYHQDHKVHSIDPKSDDDLPF